MGAFSPGGNERASGTCLSAVIFVIRRETALYILETELFEDATKIWGLGQKDRLGEVGMGKTEVVPRLVAPRVNELICHF